MSYRCEATSLKGFVQQLACCYLTHGFYHYVEGFIPKDKDPAAVDRKLIERYRIDISKSQRARRKQAGHANVHYLRFERYFVLLLTEGEHWFRTDEAKALRDVREDPIKVGGYSIRVRQGHSHVRIEQSHYASFKAQVLGLAVHRSSEVLERTLWTAPWEPYVPVRTQLWYLLRDVNALRRRAGYERVERSCIRFRRDVVRVFDREGEGAAAGFSEVAA